MTAVSVGCIRPQIQDLNSDLSSITSIDIDGSFLLIAMVFGVILLYIFVLNLFFIDLPLFHNRLGEIWQKWI